MEIPKLSPKKETQTITNFIQKTFEKTGKQNAVVALSGGIDSSVSLMLTAKALELKHIYPLHLPSKTTPSKNTAESLLIAKLAGIPPKNFTTINISSLIQKTWRVINHHAGSTTHYPKETPHKKKKNQIISAQNQLRLANISARIRMNLIYDHAKKHDALVVGTENLSEHMLGYYTRFGDEASDIEPIRHLYKTQVYQLAKHLKIPQEIIDKPPSADLWKNQTDEKELGFSYQEADPILHLIDQRKTQKQIIQEGFEETLVTKVTDRVKSSSFKHEVPYLL